MTIHKEGYVSILIATILLVVVYFVSDKYIQTNWIKSVCILIALAFFILILQFFRNPSRQLTEDTSAVVSPADGKIVVIEKVYEKEFLKKECMQVSIFMSPFNVHINRNPVSGVVKFFKYHPGKYLVAWHPKSSELNERTTTVIETPGGQQILFRQIAGAVARRIRWYIKEGQPVKQNHEMGFIKFGSRVDVFLPLESNIKVKIGDKMVGGQTILADL